MKIKKRIKEIETNIEALRRRISSLSTELNVRCPPKTVKWMRFTPLPPLTEGQIPKQTALEECFGFACKKCRRISRYTAENDKLHNGLCEICYREEIENPEPDSQPIPPLPKGV